MFKYVNNVIKNFFFGNSINMWYNELPKPELVYIIIDAINFSRIERDFLKEDLMYFFMIELMRSPEEILKVTGKMKEHNLAAHKLK
jgi:Piezo non-specific cation channel, R-Ras-binding domain